MAAPSPGAWSSCFESRLVPLFVRRTEAVSELLPQLYLHGLGQGDFELALRDCSARCVALRIVDRAAAGEMAAGVRGMAKSAAGQSRSSVRLADGLYVKAGLEDTKAALLVIVGALRDGRKVVLAIESGQRESKESCARVLRDLLARGLRPWQARTLGDPVSAGRGLPGWS